MLLSTTTLAIPCTQMVPFGYPVVPKLTKLCKTDFVILYDNQYKIPRYTSHLLVPNALSINIPRINAFYVDTQLPMRYRTLNIDFKNDANDIIDRGHMVPFEDVNFSVKSASESMLLSNITPQYSKLNRGAWKSLEQHIRKWVVKYPKGLYVITGAIVLPPVHYIGNGVAIPTSYYKILVDLENNSSIGFLYPNDVNVKTDYKQYIVPAFQIEQLANITFFPTLPTNHKIHTQVDTNIIK